MPALAIMLIFFWLGLLGVTLWAWTTAGSPIPSLLGGGSQAPAALASPAPAASPGTGTTTVALVYSQEGLTRLLTDVGKAALVVGAGLVLALGLSLLVQGKSRGSDK